MKTLKEIINSNRGNGNTTWILKNTILNPECIIMCLNESHKKEMTYLYKKYFHESAWYIKLYWKIFVRKEPVFLTRNDIFVGIKIPIIFDNDSLREI